MNTLYVKVTADCEGVVTALGRGKDWSISSEEYNSDGSGLIEINFNHDGYDSSELSVYEMQALNTHSGVIQYWTV